jgi:asparagine synthetase B (glutamine-hydrolysing)
MIAARDRFGIKPLFYARVGETLTFASEVTALFAMGVPARWDEVSVFHAVSMTGYQSRTLYGRSGKPSSNVIERFVRRLGRAHGTPAIRLGLRDRPRPLRVGFCAGGAL